MEFVLKVCFACYSSYILIDIKRYISIGGEPLRGLIQDHIVMGVRMTCQVNGVFFTTFVSLID